MTQNENKKNVTVSYVGTLDNGRIFHSTDEHGPLTFTTGCDELFPALESAVLGMRVGEVKNILLSAAEAYGPRLDENIIRLSRHLFPAGKEITVGQKLSIDFKGGVSKVMIVIEASDSEVTLDGNHPLAGCDLTFALRVDAIE
ncbi:MAG: FKBP-type peptidyl-prolyl cis-trans isomerase [Desulfuromonadaceae bacterium]|nr:FKBP-type peptidyl-prolyl cis-trans isomerase [Desulfuromonadaceae bacterium]MDD2856131.1 FKBP-type peptidyl-prolyl cis-trans isomerase [Desulfuromonadaceae bacterium]